MPDYAIWRFWTSQLHGQRSFRDGPAADAQGKAVGTIMANDSYEALTRFLAEGGVEGRRIELAVTRDPRGEDQAYVEIAYQRYVARRAKPNLLAEEPKAQPLEDEDHIGE